MKKIYLFITTIFFTFIISTFSFAGQFVADAYGFKYDVGGGRFIENGWAWCDPTGTGVGYCYYFTPSGYILVNTAAPDGSILDALGRWSENGVEQTKFIEPFGYELATAAYNATPDPNYGLVPGTGLTPDAIPAPDADPATGIISVGSLAHRLHNLNSARVTSFTLGSDTYADAIEFTEGYQPSASFNSGANTKLRFHLTGDDIEDVADFYMDIYIDGNWSRRIHQRFIEALPYTLQFAPNQEITFLITQINDYHDRYVRRVYLYNGYFE